MKALEKIVEAKENMNIGYIEWANDCIDEAIVDIEEAMKPKTCEGCKHKPNDGECYYEPCGTCARFFYDHYSPKDNA